jgi:hypothetical protein
MMIEKDPDPHLWLVDPDPGGPKTRGSGFGSATLLRRCCFVWFGMDNYQYYLKQDEQRLFFHRHFSKLGSNTNVTFSSYRWYIDYKVTATVKWTVSRDGYNFLYALTF